MKTEYLNPHNLRQAVIQLRLRTLDTFAHVETVMKYVPKEVDGRAVPGEDVNCAVIESTLTPEQISTLLSTPQSTEETDSLTQYVAMTQQMRDEFASAINTLQNHQNATTNAEVIAAVKFQAKTLERLLRLYKMQLAGRSGR